MSNKVEEDFLNKIRGEIKVIDGVEYVPLSLFKDSIGDLYKHLSDVVSDISSIKDDIKDIQ